MRGRIPRLHVARCQLKAAAFLMRKYPFDTMRPLIYISDTTHWQYRWHLRDGTSPVAVLGVDTWGLGLVRPITPRAFMARQF